MSEITYQEKQELIIKAKIQALEKVRERVQKELKEHPASIQYKIDNIIGEDIIFLKVQLNQLYPQLKMNNL